MQGAQSGLAGSAGGQWKRAFWTVEAGASVVIIDDQYYSSDLAPASSPLLTLLRPSQTGGVMLMMLDVFEKP